MTHHSELDPAAPETSGSLQDKTRHFIEILLRHPYSTFPDTQPGNVPGNRDLLRVHKDPEDDVNIVIASLSMPPEGPVGKMNIVVKKTEDGKTTQENLTYRLRSDDTILFTPDFPFGEPRELTDAPEDEAAVHALDKELSFLASEIDR